MKKNGFTLIELLAVIVILAIIALIATPIILGIINDAREESNERSVELYASAIRNGIASYQLREGKEIASGSYTTDTLPMEVEYEGDVECATIDIYEDGGVYVANCTVNGSAVEYTYGIKQPVKLNSICTLDSDSTVTGTTPGAKYECKVDPNKDPYTFYVLNVKGTKVNLIMNQNINSDGTLATEGIKQEDAINGVYNLVDWLDLETFEAVGGNPEDLTEENPACKWDGMCVNIMYGPLTAIDFLKNATSNWTNLDEMIVDSFTSDYTSSADYYKMVKTYNMYARLPYASELGCDDNPDNCELANYIEGSSSNNKYWLSTINSDFYVHLIVGKGLVVDYPTDGSVNPASYNDVGVRPVITLEI